MNNFMKIVHINKKRQHFLMPMEKKYFQIIEKKKHSKIITTILWTKLITISVIDNLTLINHRC